MRSTRKTARERVLRALTTALVLAVLAALFLAGAAQAAKPGRPTALTPNATSTVITTTPTFKWGKAARAARYEVRVYRGTALQVKRTGVTKLSWKSSRVLTKAVTYSWKVRGRKAGVNGPWSSRRKFTVAAAGTAIGQHYAGGVIAYILQPGDPGCVAGETHGLIAATADQSTGIIWSTEPNWDRSVPGGTGTALGTGSANTNKIIAQNGAGTSYAAGLARAYRGGGYSDWYLPSKDELNKLYLNRAAIGGFNTTAAGPYYYWSSSEADYLYVAWEQSFNGGTFNDSNAYVTDRVRAVRAF